MDGKVNDAQNKSPRVEMIVVLIVEYEIDTNFHSKISLDNMLNHEKNVYSSTK